MMRLKHDFQNDTVTQESWYNLREDWVLVEASLAKQYGIRIRNESNMPWLEFCTLVGGLMPDTPLGQVVGIRSETDVEIIRNYSTDQNRIHDDWQKRLANNKLEDKIKLEKDMEAMSLMLASMFGKGVG